MDTTTKNSRCDGIVGSELNCRCHLQSSLIPQIFRPPQAADFPVVRYLSGQLLFEGYDFQAEPCLDSFHLQQMYWWCRSSVSIVGCIHPAAHRMRDRTRKCFGVANPECPPSGLRAGDGWPTACLRRQHLSVAGQHQRIRCHFDAHQPGYVRLQRQLQDHQRLSQQQLELHRVDPGLHHGHRRESRPHRRDK